MTKHVNKKTQLISISKIIVEFFQVKKHSSIFNSLTLVIFLTFYLSNSLYRCIGFTMIAHIKYFTCNFWLCYDSCYIPWSILFSLWLWMMTFSRLWKLLQQLQFLSYVLLLQFYNFLKLSICKFYLLDDWCIGCKIIRCACIKNELNSFKVFQF